PRARRAARGAVPALAARARARRAARVRVLRARAQGGRACARHRAARGGAAVAAAHLARGELRRAMSVRAARLTALVAPRPVVGAAGPARAALPLSLTWVAPTGCPTAADVRAEVERLVRFPPGQEPAALVAEGRVENRDGRWRLRLHTERDGVP